MYIQHFIYAYAKYRGFLGGSVVENMTAMQKTQVQFLGQEDALEKEMATHSRILVWAISRTEEPGELQSMGYKGVGNDLVTK